MAFSYTSKKSGQTYYLHTKDVNLKGGKQVTIYFFARDQRPNACDMPGGYEVVENPRTGMPLLKKEKK